MVELPQCNSMLCNNAMPNIIEYIIVQDGCGEHKGAMSPKVGKMKGGPWETKLPLPCASL